MKNEKRTQESIETAFLAWKMQELLWEKAPYGQKAGTTELKTNCHYAPVQGGLHFVWEGERGLWLF